MAKSSIEWTEHVWNPIRGCSRISEGCRSCYAERMAARFCATGETDQSGEVVLSAGPFAGFARTTPSGPRWTGRVELIPEMLDIPLRRKKPTTYFVNSMSDLFHEALSDEAIDRVFAVMALCPQHRFICLTKRARRMAEWAAVRLGAGHRGDKINELMKDWAGLWRSIPSGRTFPRCTRWPLPNVILGVSCEDQAAADERIPYLLRTPAACRMVSLEPLLGPIRLWKLASLDYHENTIGYETYPLAGMQAVPDCDWEHPKLDWVIVGGESGPGARPMRAEWARSLRDQCTAARVPFFFKQWGEWLPAGQDGALGDGQVLNCSNEPMRVGKRAAGRLLDGRVWDERPEVLR